jgi:uncharacterized protein YegP (UPF0339 family)
MSTMKVGHRQHRRRAPTRHGQETCMPDSPEEGVGRSVRPVYWKRQTVSADDLTAGQEHLRRLLREHNRLNHGPGVVCGLEVLPADHAASGHPCVTVTHGYAIGPQGDEIYVPDDQLVVIDCVPQPGDECLDPTITPIAQEVHLVIGYRETQACPVLHLVAACDPSPICEHRRVEAGFDVQCQIITPPPPSPHCQAWIDELMRCGPPASLSELPFSFLCSSGDDSPWVILARLHVDENGQVAEIDYGVRQRNFSMQLLGSLVRCMAGLAPVAGDDGPRFEIDVDHRGEFGWRLLAASGEIIAASRRFLTRTEAEIELERIRHLAVLLPTDDPVAFSRAEQPVETVLGIGPIYKCRLETLDIRTIGQLAVAQPTAVAAALGVSSRRATAFVEAANRLLSD